MLSPDERRKLFTNKFDKNGQPVGIVLGGRGFNFDLSDQEIEALANISVKRDTHRDSSYAAQEMLESQFGNVQPKGYTMMSHLAKTSSNIKDEDVVSFDQLIKRFKKPRRNKTSHLVKRSKHDIIQQQPKASTFAVKTERICSMIWRV